MEKNITGESERERIRKSTTDRQTNGQVEEKSQRNQSTTGSGKGTAKRRQLLAGSKQILDLFSVERFLLEQRLCQSLVLGTVCLENVLRPLIRFLLRQ